LSLREEHRLKAFGYRVLRKMFGPKRDELKQAGENCIMKSIQHKRGRRGSI
jgi:hypothetical protein